jgi:hypothetical protein
MRRGRGEGRGRGRGRGRWEREGEVVVYLVIVNTCFSPLGHVLAGASPLQNTIVITRVRNISACILE